MKSAMNGTAIVLALVVTWLALVWLQKSNLKRWANISTTGRLVEAFAEQHGRMPASWKQLDAASDAELRPEGLFVPERDSFEWTIDVERVRIRFGADVEELRQQDDELLVWLEPTVFLMDHVDVAQRYSQSIFAALKGARQSHSTAPARLENDAE